MFSSRTAWDRALNPLARAAAAPRAPGPLLDLTGTTPTPPGLVAPPGIHGQLAAPAAGAYTPDAAGWRPAREAIAADYARRGAAVAGDDVVLTASTSEAYAHRFKVLCDPGDAVLVPRPS
jgi:aspartate/methionine/tyrosine aminotransferase